MSQPFVGEITVFAFGFNPRGWALCNGQLLAIAQNQALFALLGTTYGGNGTTNFALPNLQSRSGLSFGQGPGLSNYALGTPTGVENVTLTTQQMPQHVHSWVATTANGDQPAPAGGFLASAIIPNGTSIKTFAAAGGATVPLAANTVAAVGSNVPHANMQPFLVMNYSIALQGIFPSRN